MTRGGRSSNRSDRTRSVASGRRGARASGSFALHGSGEVSAALERGCRWIGLAVVAGVAAVLTLVVAGPHRIGDYFTETDFYGAYAAGARLIQNGHVDASRYGVVGPGYEMALALAGLAVRNLFVAAELISATATIATLLIWRSLLRRLGDARLAVLGVLFLATNPVLLRFGYSVTTDAFALMLLSLALWLLLSRTSARGLLAAGGVAAAAFLTRYSAVSLVPAAFVTLAFGLRPAAGRSRAVIAFAGGFLIVLVPWMSWCAAHGTGLAFALHHNIAYEVFARPRGIVWDDYQKLLQPQFHSLSDVIRRDPGAVAARLLDNVGDHLRLDAHELLGWPVAICAALGLALTLIEGSFRRLAPLAIFGACAFLVLVPVFHAPRYSLALLPVDAAFASAFFASPRFAFAVGRSRRVRLKTLLVLVPLSLAVGASWREQTRTLAKLPVEILDAARALRAVAGPHDRVMARKPHLAWLSGLEGRPFPFADSLPQLGAAAHAAGVRWLYVSWPEVETRPRFWYLLDTTATVPGLTPRLVTTPNPSVLYEVGPAFGTKARWMTNDTLLTWHGARAMILVDKGNPEPLQVLGTLEYQHDMFDSATVHLRRSLRLQPRNAVAWLLLGQIALQRGIPAEAERACREALRIEPSNVDAQATLGWAILLQGRKAEAIEHWRAVVGSVEDPATLERMADLFEESGDALNARAARVRLEQLGATP